MARLLVVDDEPDLRFLIRVILERAGHEVVEAPHGAAALMRIAEHQPDLLVTDMMMPVMDGTELIARLRSDPTLAAIPILMVTANPQYAAAADAVLAKPFEPKKLVELATSLLAGGP